MIVLFYSPTLVVCKFHSKKIDAQKVFMPDEMISFEMKPVTDLAESYVPCTKLRNTFINAHSVAEYKHDNANITLYS